MRRLLSIPCGERGLAPTLLTSIDRRRNTMSKSQKFTWELPVRLLGVSLGIVWICSAIFAPATWYSSAFLLLMSCPLVAPWHRVSGVSLWRILFAFLLISFAFWIYLLTSGIVHMFLHHDALHVIFFSCIADIIIAVQIPAILSIRRKSLSIRSSQPLPAARPTVADLGR